MDKEVGQRNKCKSSKITQVPLVQISSSALQPRRDFDEHKVSELARSIKEHGILQPLIVRVANAQKYEIVAGERRYRAAHLAGLKRVPCLVMDLANIEALAVALVENIQRQDLNAIEEGLAYLRLRETMGLSQEEIAKRVGKDRASIANTMRLLRLPKSIQDLVVCGLLSMGHAKALLALENKDLMLMLGKKVAREGLSVRRVEGLVRVLKHGYRDQAGKPPLSSEKEGLAPLEREIKQKLEMVLGVRVVFKKELGHYSILVNLQGPEQLNGLLERLGIEL